MIYYSITEGLGFHLFTDFFSQAHPGRKTYNGTIEFKTNKDLYYSIQHCSFEVGFNTISEFVYANVKISDEYDFNEMRSYGGASFDNLINDAGFITESIFLGTPYRFEITFSFEVN